MDINLYKEHAFLQLMRSNPGPHGGYKCGITVNAFFYQHSRDMTCRGASLRRVSIFDYNRGGDLWELDVGGVVCHDLHFS